MADIDQVTCRWSKMHLVAQVRNDGWSTVMRGNPLTQTERNNLPTREKCLSTDRVAKVKFALPCLTSLAIINMSFLRPNSPCRMKTVIKGKPKLIRQLLVACFQQTSDDGALNSWRETTTACCDNVCCEPWFNYTFNSYSVLKCSCDNCEHCKVIAKTNTVSWTIPARARHSSSV